MDRYTHNSLSTGRPCSLFVAARRILQAHALALLIGILSSSVEFTTAAATPSPSAPATITTPTTTPATTPTLGAPLARTWQPGPVYTQIGSSCVGYSLASLLDAEPRPVQSHASGWDLYLAARQVDGIGQPHDGTTVQAGIEVISRLGFVRSWKSTQDVGEALGFLRTEGPIVLETDFPQDQPVVDGQQNLVWTGRMGPHAWLCYGVDAQDRLSCQNSSGVHWNEAEGGRLHVTRATLTKLVADGTAWLITKAQAAGSGN